MIPNDFHTSDGTINYGIRYLMIYHRELYFFRHVSQTYPVSNDSD